MKKIITLILLFISIISFGQNSEYKKAQKLVKDKMYTEANILFEKLLNKEYRELDEITQLNCLTTNANCYFALNDYKTAYDKYTLLLKIIKSTKIEIPNKDEYVAGVIKFMDDLKSKIPQDSNSSSAVVVTSESNSTTNTDSSKPASDDKTVTLTVSGTGKTLEEAKLNALRSAIEQAFGAFISSKTEILNDNLIKDEIVSIANGNIQKYDIVSQIEIPGVGFATTLNAIVSISKLTSFAEGKGVIVEFKGGMFGLKIKLQKLNEESEFIAINNLLSQTFDMLEKSIDYSLNVKEPKLAEKHLQSNTNDIYTVGLEVIENKNENYDNCLNYLIRTLSKIALNDNEANEITKNGKDLCYLLIDGQYLRFRNEKSINALFNFSMICSMIAPNTFCIKNNFGIVRISGHNKARIFSSYINYYQVSSDKDKIDFNVELIANPQGINVEGVPLIEYVKKNGFNINQLLELNLAESENIGRRKDKFLKLMPFFNYSNYYKGNGENLYYELNLKLSDVEKIESFQIEKLPFGELLMKRELYRN